MSSPEDRPQTDEEVEREWRSGRRAAFAELFRRYYARGVAYAARFVGGDLAAAEDLAQQAFMNLLQRTDGKGRFKSLLYTVLRNLALNERRRRGRRYVAQTGLDDRQTGGAAPPWQPLVEREEQEAFGRALAQLDAEEREAFLLHELDGLTYREIGQVMSLHPDAARRRVAKAFLALRQRLDAGRDHAENQESP